MVLCWQRSHVICQRGCVVQVCFDGSSDKHVMDGSGEIERL